MDALTPNLFPGAPRVGAGPAGAGGEPIQARRLRKAAQEFEGILVAAWWRSMLESFPGGSEAGLDSGRKTIQDLSMQAVGMALAASKGLGIGEMLVRQIGHGLTQGAGKDRVGGIRIP